MIWWVTDFCSIWRFKKRLSNYVWRPVYFFCFLSNRIPYCSLVNIHRTINCILKHWCQILLVHCHVRSSKLFYKEEHLAIGRSVDRRDSLHVCLSPSYRFRFPGWTNLLLRLYHDCSTLLHRSSVTWSSLSHKGFRNSERPKTAPIYLLYSSLWAHSLLTLGVPISLCIALGIQEAIM